MKIIKNFWGIFPILTFLLLKAVLLITEKSLNIVLRDTPDGILFWFAILSVLVFILYIIIKFFSWNRVKDFKFFKIIKSILIVLYCAGFLVTLLGGVFFHAFTYYSDDVVEENGVKMVARDTSYLDFGREYYEYENMLFRGKQVLKKISNKTYWVYSSDGELIETGTYDN